MIFDFVWLYTVNLIERKNFNDFTVQLRKNKSHMQSKSQENIRTKSESCWMLNDGTIWNWTQRMARSNYYTKFEQDIFKSNHKRKNSWKADTSTILWLYNKRRYRSVRNGLLCIQKASSTFFPVFIINSLIHNSRNIRGMPFWQGTV